MSQHGVRIVSVKRREPLDVARLARLLLEVVQEIDPATQAKLAEEGRALIAALPPDDDVNEAAIP